MAANNDRNYPRTRFWCRFWHFRPLDDIVWTNDVNILNLQVISFQTRYRTSKSVQPNLQKLTFCLGCQNKEKCYPRTRFRCRFRCFRPLDYIVWTNDVNILNLQVISFQTRYRTSKSVQPNLQKLTFCLGCQNKEKCYPRTCFRPCFRCFHPLDDIVWTNDVNILNLQVISFQTRYRTSKSVQPNLQKLTFCLGCQNKEKCYPRTCFRPCFRCFHPLDDIVWTNDVNILNLQVISFQTRYRTSKSVQPNLQKLTFCLGCQNKEKCYPRTRFRCRFRCFRPLDYIVWTNDVNILNLQVISFQTRYRTSKSVQPNLQKLTFCLGCQNKEKCYPRTCFRPCFRCFHPLDDIVWTNDVNILNLQVISFQTRYRTSKSVQPNLQKLTFCLGCQNKEKWKCRNFLIWMNIFYTIKHDSLHKSYMC